MRFASMPAARNLGASFRSALLAALALLAPATAAPAGLKGVSWLEERCPPEFSLRGEVRGWPDAPSAAMVTVAFNHADPSNCLLAEFSRSRAMLVRRESGKITPLACVPVSPDQRGRIGFTVKRRLWRITLICNGRVVAHAYDTKMHGGACGWMAAAPLSVDLQLQPTEPVAFADDFTRSAREDAQWETLAGRWAIGEVPLGNHRGTVGRFSPNAFAWVARPAPLAVCTAGYWFWDSYVLETSVRPEGRGAVGVLAFVQEDGDGYLFRWTATAPGQPQSGAGQILRIRDGRAALLASVPGGYQPHQWYRVRLSACEGTLAAYIDGRLVCVAHDAAFGQGKVGLYAEDSQATFDDVNVAPTDALAEAFHDAPPGKWEDAGAPWRTHVNLHHRCMARAGEGITLAGSPDWNEYALTADVGTGRADQVGLCFGYTDARSYSLFCVPTRSGEKARLLRIREGESSLVAESAMPVRAERRAHLRLAVSREVTRAYVNGLLVIEGATPLGTGGRIGCYARGGSGARFSDLAVSFPFSDSPARSWWRLAADGALWHIGEFPGHHRVRADIPCARGSSPSTLAICADGARLGSGYQLSAEVAPDGKIRLELARSGHSVASASAPLPEDAASLPLRLWRSRSLVAGALGDNVAVSYQDPEPLAGGHVGVRVAAPKRAVASLEASGTNVLDCTFASAPVEWWAGRGDWRVANRWPCDDRFSYFGGLGSESPVLWTKRAFSGDMTVEAWMGLYMDNIADRVVGYRHPSDLNLSFCANGKDLSSGYSFLFAAANNTVTRLLRKEQVVAENPNVKMVNAVRTNVPWQRHWYHLRVEKRGSRLRCFVDDQLAAEYADPDPLPGGQVALWTWRNGLMLARARVSYDDDGGWNPIPVVEAPPTHPDAGVRPHHTPSVLGGLGGAEPWPFAEGKAPRWWAYTLGLVPASPARALGLQTTPASTAAWALSHASPLVLACNSEDGLAGWVSEPGPEGPLLTIDQDLHGNRKPGGASATVPSGPRSGRELPRGRRCLRAVNRISGGAFAVLCGVQRFDAVKFPVLAFDYRMPASTKLNLYLRVGQQQYVVELSAPSAREPAVSLLGSVAGFSADGEWHTAQFELLAALRRVLPAAPSVIVEDLCVRAPDVEYLRSGFGGNYWGTEWRLGNFRLVGAPQTTRQDAGAVHMRASG